MRTLLVAGTVFSLLALYSFADDAPVKSRDDAEALVSSLKFQTGKIALRNGLAEINVPEQFRYLDGDDAQTVLVRLWHNPPSPKPLGMILPAHVSPISRECWAVTVEYEEDGYIKDNDAEKIDYAALLKKMKAGTRDSNKERVKQGYPEVELVGWATPPHYDKAAHKLYWAKEISFGKEPEHTLNYNIRVLGRRGVLVLNAIASINQLPEVEKSAPEILKMVDFKEGHRYVDFDSSTDKVATYGIAALVAGGVAAKLGFFKLIWVFILGAKKLIIVAAVAITGWFRKIFKRKGSV